MPIGLVSAKWTILLVHNCKFKLTNGCSSPQMPKGFTTYIYIYFGKRILMFDECTPHIYYFTKHHTTYR